MKEFTQWLAEKQMGENGLRTSLGIYPPQYGTGQYPPLYFTPISAVAPLLLKKLHGHEHPELLTDDKKPKKKSKKKNKKTKKSKKKD